MGLKALIFSMDGVLVDTHEAGHLRAFNSTFNDENLPWHWSNKVYQNLLSISGDKEKLDYYMAKYKPAFRATKEFGNKEDFINHIAEIKQKHYLDVISSGKLQIRTGVKRLLLEAKRKDIALAIATTTSYKNVKSLINATLGEEAIKWFQVIGSYETVKNKKPATDIYKWVVGELGFDAHECVAMEGSLIGVESSSNADIKTISIANKYSKHDDFVNAHSAVSELCDTDDLLKVYKGKRPHNNWVDIDFLTSMLEPASHKISLPTSSLIVLIILLTLLGIALSI